jgi:hypothetical protein
LKNTTMAFPDQATRDTFLLGSSVKTLATSAYDALKRIATGGWQAKLDAQIVQYDRSQPGQGYPDFLFPFTDPAIPDTSDQDKKLYEDDSNTTDKSTRNLFYLVEQALKVNSAPARMPPTPLAAQPVVDADQTGWFVLRMMYECPNCGPLRPVVISQPSVVFQMASFFEPRAPARPIRISLPMNTTPAGFRQFAKNTAFVVSDTLACQKERLGGLSFGDLVLSVLPWPFHQDLPSDLQGGPCTPVGGGVSFGMICSLSIPIITICALILLIIIVSLLNIVFQWLPYFMICFPFPRFRAKESS